MTELIRVFTRRTSMTPCDPLAFAGDPPMWRPEGNEVHISVAFTWDIHEAYRLAGAWGQYYPVVKVGGPGTGFSDGTFTPGLYVRHGVTITSRGCNNSCPWCLVPEREGKLHTLPISPGYIVQDNNLLQCDHTHIERVFAMLRVQSRAVKFSGGFQSSLLKDWIADELRGMRIHEVWFSADYEEAIKPLRVAVSKLSFLPRKKLRCYVLLGYDGEAISKAESRLESVWGAGCLPFAQLYQPPDEYIEYSRDWKELARKWCRPAAMYASHEETYD